MTMKMSFAALTLAGLAFTAQPAIAAANAGTAGCRQITINGVERTMCPGQEAIINPRQQRAKRISDRYATQPIMVSAAAQLEVTADQLTISIRFSEQAEDMLAVIEKLKQKRESIADVAKNGGLSVTGIEINQLDVNQRNRGNGVNYQGNANFEISVTGFADPLDAVARLSSLDAQSIGRIQFSMSPEGSARAKEKLRELAEENARAQAEQQALMRGQKLGKLMSLDFQSNDRQMRSRQMTFTLSGHGRATFAPE